MLAIPVGVALLFYQESTILLDVSKRYVEQDLASSGAVVRLLMNVVPALIFLFFAKNFRENESFNRTWRATSILALLMFVVLVFGAPSTLIDRFSLYLIPLQLMVFGRLVDVFGRRIGKTLLKASIVIYCFAVQFVWFFIGEFSYAWVPYNSYLLLNM
jgi:hypothetical protein